MLDGPLYRRAVALLKGQHELAQPVNSRSAPVQTARARQHLPRVLGIHVVSRGASDIVGSLAVALQLGVTVDDFAEMHHIYPSFSEGLKAAAEQAA